MTRKKGVNNLQVIDLVSGVQVFGIENTAAALHRGVNHHRIPIPKMVELMQIDGGKNIIQSGLKPQQPREECNALLCKQNIQVHFAAGVMEVFSKNLQRDSAVLCVMCCSTSLTAISRFSG